MKHYISTMAKVFVIAIIVTASNGTLFAVDDEEIQQAPKPLHGISSTQIVSLYEGFITNKYEEPDKGVSMTDSGLITGVFAQWVQYKSFQANLLGYWSPDVNYSRVFGIHANVDGYFLSMERATLVAGLDFENINIDMDAGSNAKPGITEFKLKHNIFYGMARTGASVILIQDPSLYLNIFPYVGITHQSVTGDISFVHPTGPPTFAPAKSKFKIDDKQNYFSWGVNINALAFRSVSIGLKYLGRAEKDNYMSSYTVSTNVSITHNLFVSYQFKYMEVSSGFDRYNIFGIGYMF